MPTESVSRAQSRTLLLPLLCTLVQQLLQYVLRIFPERVPGFPAAWVTVGQRRTGYLNRTGGVF